MNFLVQLNTIYGNESSFRRDGEAMRAFQIKRQPRIHEGIWEQKDAFKYMQSEDVDGIRAWIADEFLCLSKDRRAKVLAMR